VALVVRIAAVAWSTKSHRQPGPLALTIAGALGVACGRLIWSVPALV
jgi:hypothetical protein